MQVKVFEAKDMTSGLKMVKKDLGPDALILSTRTLRGGKLGMLGKPVLEITAAIDSTWPDKEKSIERTGYPASLSQSDTRQSKDTLTYDNLWSEETDDNDAEPTCLSRTCQPQAETEIGSDSTVLSNEISELRAIIDGLSRRLGSMDAPLRTKAYVEPEYSAPTAAATANPVMQLLLSRGINHQVAGLVSRFVGDTMQPEGKIPAGDLPAMLTKAISRLFTVAPPLTQKLTRQKRLSLIGPTGVGKTTTIAKLAAGYLNRFGGKVALITIDTYRIAAVEQLKVYGEIMRLPVEVVIKPDDMAPALSRHSDCDLILIDTAGRSPGNASEIQDMCSFLRPEYALENHLLLPATNREIELETIINTFSCLPITRFIFSKVDECRLLGVLLNIHYSHDTPISYLTNGQRVPEDIIAATPEILAQRIMNPNNFLNNG